MNAARRRANISAVVAAFCGSNKLRSQQVMLEKMQEKIISQLKSFSVKERSELLELSRSLESKAQREVAEMQDELLGIFDLLKEVKREIKDPEKLKVHDVPYFRNKISELERRIFTLQDNCTKELKKLVEEESSLMVEMDLMEERIDSWCSNKQSLTRRHSATSIVKCTCSDESRNLTQRKNKDKLRRILILLLLLAVVITVIFASIKHFLVFKRLYK